MEVYLITKSPNKMFSDTLIIIDITKKLSTAKMFAEHNAQTQHNVESLSWCPEKEDGHYSAVTKDWIYTIQSYDAN